MRRAWAITLTVALAATAHANESALDPQGRAMLDEIRVQALRPDALIARLRIPSTARIADVGAGPGFLTLPLARAAPRGSVTATDLRADYLAVARARAERAGLHNVTTLVVTADAPGLPAHAFDLIVVCQVDHYLRDRVSYFVGLARALRDGGRIALVNYTRFRDADVAAARAAGLSVIDEWRPSVPFFLLVLAPGRCGAMWPC